MSTATASTYGTDIASTYVGKATDGDWAHYAWTVTLTRDGKTRTLPYKMGLGHVQTPCGKPLNTASRYRSTPCDHVRCQNVEKPTPPTLYDVLTSLKADTTDGETFEDWCSNVGYDTDSRKALATYLACQESENESRRFFGSDWRTILDDQDYE